MRRVTHQSPECPLSECGLVLKRAARFSAQEAAPLFDRELHDVTVDEGDAVTLECWLRPAAPAPSVRWRHDDRELKNDADFRQTYEGERNIYLTTYCACGRVCCVHVPYPTRVQEAPFAPKLNIKSGGASCTWVFRTGYFCGAS